MAVYDNYDYGHRLHIAILSFNMNDATFKLLPKPIEFDFRHERKICDIFEKMVDICEPNSFGRIEFECYELVQHKLILRQRANIHRHRLERSYFACSRLWFYNFNVEDKSIAQLASIKYIVPRSVELRNLSLEPLPAVFNELEAWKHDESSDQVSAFSCLILFSTNNSYFRRAT